MTVALQNNRSRLAGLALAAAIAATLALLGGCQSTSGVRERSRPLADSPLAAAILDPKIVSPGNLELLRRENLLDVRKRDPDAAIAELGRRLARNPSPQYRAALAELWADTGDRLARTDPEKALGYFLAAADTAYPEVVRGQPSPQRATLVTIYNHCAGKVVMILFESGHDRGATVEVAGPLQAYRISLARKQDAAFDPAYVDTLRAAEYLDVHGIRARHVQSGIGAALVGHRRQTPGRAATQPFLAPVGMGFPVTAILRFSSRGNDVEIVLHDALARDTVRLDGRTFPLSADFTAPLATLLNYKPKENVGFKGMLRPDEYMDRMGLYQVGPFRDDRIPVVFVHGLMSSPEIWIDALNTLRADPVLRENYQLLVYLYPTGLPIAYNGAGLRRHLHEFQEHYDLRHRLPAMREMILIGHSMGGILSNLQIRDSGEHLRELLFARPLDEVDLTETQRESLGELMYFRASPDVRRAVFVASPHRGSEIAGGPIGKLGSKLIKFPVDLITGQAVRKTVDGMTELGQNFMVNRPDSVMALRAHWPMLEAILELPVSPRVTYHSIIGNPGAKPLEQSSDKVVSYWSAHLDGAASEKIFKASHVTITADPGAIEEIRRILYLHIGHPYTPGPAAARQEPTPRKTVRKAGQRPRSPNRFP